MPPIALTASVALTSPGGRNRNRLRLGCFGVSDLRLSLPDGPSSRCHRPEVSATTPGEDDFHFVPEHEPVEIAYALDNDFDLVRAGRLELFTRHRKAPLWTRALKPEELLPGEHRLPWDGRVPAGDLFPDGVVTVEHSPYKLRLTLDGTGWARAPVAWTYFHVLVDDVTLELGDPRVLARPQDRELVAALGRLPAPGEKAEVRLVSNLFKAKADEMEDDTGFTEYRAAWNSGPRIPIFARAWLRDSRGRRVDAPKALGRVRFLWDWEDVTEDTAAHAPKVRAFLDQAIDRYRVTTQPKGDNAHTEVGGKRGAPSEAVFPRQAGQPPGDALKEGAFPFRVKPCNKRGWAATSTAWTSGELAGRTGVLFQPSRIAGDAWRVTVQLAFDKRRDGGMVLDVEDDAPLPAAVRACTGTFETWREVHVARVVRKHASIPGFSLAAVQAHYERAFLRVVDRTGGKVIELDPARYNARLAAEVAKRPVQVQAAIDPTVDQHAAGDHAVTFRAWPDFIAELKRRKGVDDAELMEWLAKDKAPGRPSPDTAHGYHAICKEWARLLVTFVCDADLGTTPGIALFMFSGLYNLETAPGGRELNGFSPEFPSQHRQRCAIVLCAKPSNYGRNFNSLEQTIAHEIGHHLFLPHAPFPVERRLEGARAADHDQDGGDCLMGYDYSVERRFCGFCLLRLRGWDKRALDSNGPRNTKP